MPENLTPQDQWETEFQVPLPGEPRNIGPLRTLFQRLLNRTERLKGRFAEILGLPWDATPPSTLNQLHGRVTSLEGALTGPLVVPSLRIADQRLLHVYVDQGADTQTRYYLLGRVSNTNGVLKIRGGLGGRAATEGRANVDLQVSYAGGLRVDGYIMGPPGAADILVRDGGDGYAYVYLVTAQNSLVNLELSRQGAAEILYDGTYSTTAPAGTTLYQLSSDYASNSHRYTLKLQDGALIAYEIYARADFRDRFVVQGVVGGSDSTYSVSVGSWIAIAHVIVGVPNNRRLYLRRIRFHASGNCVPRMEVVDTNTLTTRGMYIGSVPEGDIALNLDISGPGPTTSALKLSFLNHTAVPQNLRGSDSIWAELEIL